MGAFLDKPKTEKRVDRGEGNGLKYGLSSMQGWRVEMEDSHTAEARLDGVLSGWSFFAVFDGHAGPAVSEKCSKQLLQAILSQLSQPNPSIDDIKAGIREGFLSLDAQLRTAPEVLHGEDKSGSTAVCVLISPTHIFFANCGDSRGMLVRSKQVLFATLDHKPVNPVEKERILAAGGSVMIQRVNGSLAVSRSLGDFDYKKLDTKGPCEQLVSPEPEITVYPRSQEEDEFIVLACDGVWDVMTNEELNAYLQHRLLVSNDLAHICNEVIDNCLYKGSRDNMSIVLITFENAPKMDNKISQEDQALDEQLKVEIAKFLDQYPSGSADISDLINHLNTLELKNFPPGGIITKRHLIDAEFNEYVQKCISKNNVTEEESSKNV